MLILATVIVFYGGSRWNGKKVEQKGQSGNLADKVDNLQKSTSGNTAQIEGESATEESKITSEESQSKLCRMPDVIGMNKDAAIARISSVDIVVKISIVREYNNDVERDVVLEQNVAPDTQYNEGAIEEIVLTVSDGAKPATETSTKTSTSKSDSKQDSYDVQSDGNEAVDFYLDD